MSLLLTNNLRVLLIFLRISMLTILHAHVPESSPVGGLGIAGHSHVTIMDLRIQEQAVPWDSRKEVILNILPSDL